jgi:hypothetical protein
VLAGLSLDPGVGRADGVVGREPFGVGDIVRAWMMEEGRGMERAGEDGMDDPLGDEAIDWREGFEER